MSDDIAIRLNGVSKGFRLPNERQNTLKGHLINFGKRGYEKQEVFTNLSLDVKKGEFLGILGRNGSGKSTLLKTLSGIYTPDNGEITINGKLIPFIELGVGFNPELSGRDNVFLNGALLGFSRKEIELIYDDIVEFAELERFMDQKLKNYSSGMQVRLAFSIAIRADTDILILDEVLAVGDEAFQRKCYDYFNELKERGKTVVLVTHDMSAVKRFCTRAVVIDKGVLIYDGDTDGATDAYRKLNLKSTEQSSSVSNKRKSNKLGTSKYVKDLKTTDSKDVKKILFSPNDKIVIACKIKLNGSVENPTLQLWFNNPGGTALAAVKIYPKDFQKSKVNIGKEITTHWILDGIFNDGKYMVTAEISNSETGEIYEVIKDGCEFSVYGWDSPHVLVHPDKVIEIKQ